MNALLRLALRLAVGRDGRARTVLTAVGTGLGLALLLLSLTAPAALAGRYARVDWHDAAYSALSPDTGDGPVADTADGALFLAVTDYNNGNRMTRVYYAALGPDAPVPPGLDHAPAPGEVAVSPALRRLLAATADDELDDRFPGRVTMTIGPAGLAHDRELVGVIGRTPEQLEHVRSVGRVHGFTGVRPTAWAITAALSGFVLAGALLVLIPIVLLVATVARVDWRRREARFAALRLAGATRGQVAVLAAGEAGVGAAAGTVLGWLLYEAGRRVLAATVVFQGGHFWLDDVAVPGRWLAGALLAVPALALLTCLLSLGRMRAHRPSPRLGGFVGRWLRRLPVGVGVVLAARRIAHDPRSAFSPAVVAGLAAGGLAFLASLAPVAPAAPSGVVTIDTGGVAPSVIEQLRGPGVIVKGNLVMVPTDGSLAAENRVRTRVANLVPNAIINSGRDPIDHHLETFLADLDRLAAVAAAFVLVIGAFGVAAGTAGALLDRRRPVTLLRAAGVRWGEVRRAVLLETAATMTVASAAGVALGLLVAQVSGPARQWPGIGLYATVAAGIVAAVLCTALTLPLLRRSTRPERARFA
ncbi:FtsX-like permease family protein [Dactylosporangium sp. CS-047395]|uniref:FtsX-like permease family protein n=1 Tax=Dactylosporangium sp. CS-047395 TaxID=3239936 RepID=UPI003D94FFF1